MGTSVPPSQPGQGPGSGGGDPDFYDVVVIGGGFAGSAFTTLIRRWVPAARVLIVERNAFFHRKVGEATVEVSGHFIHRVLGMYDHLSREQLPKHGLRYWFTDHNERSLFEMSEIGPGEMPLLASFQLDRARMDQHIFDTARQEGAEVAITASGAGRSRSRTARLRSAWCTTRRSSSRRTTAGRRRAPCASATCASWPPARACAS